MAIDQSTYLPIFQAESLDLLESAESHILTIESGGSLSGIHDVFRAIHTIKGNSALFKANSLTELAHALEGLLSKMRDSTERPDMQVIDLILSAADRLREMIRSMGTEERFDNANIISKLKDLQNSSSKSNNGTLSAEETRATEASSLFKITRPPGQLLERARKSGQFLSFIHFCPSEHGIHSLSMLNDFLRTLESSGTVLKRGLKLGSNQSLYVCFFLLSNERPENAFIRSPNVSIQILHQTESKIISSGSDPERGRQKKQDDFVRIPTILVDELINLSGESVVARNELMMKIARFRDPEVDSAAKKVSRLISSLQERIIRTRLQKLDTSFSRLPRLVRDVAAVTGKKAELTIVGSDVELDKNLIAVISDPLTHLLRNAVDHGLEKPEDRKKAGKPESGQVRIEATMTGGNVVITISDDGRGLDLEKLRAKAAERGILTAEQAAQATPERLHDLIFLPGFSTAAQVTETSGRGVGMDVVRSNIQSVGGRIDLESVQGRGSTFRISLPQTLTIVTCLVVRASKFRFALVQKDVEEVMRIDASKLSRVEDRFVYELRGQILPVLDLTTVLDYEREGQDRYIIVVRTDRYRFGILCHKILDQQEFVLKPLGEELQHIQTYAGAGLLGDGDAVLVLDVAGLARQAKIEPAREEDQTQEETLSNKQKNTYFLFRYKTQQFAIHSSARPGLRKVGARDIFTYLGRESIQDGDMVLPVIRLDEYFGSQRTPDEARMFALIIHRNGVGAAILATKMLALLSRIEDLNQPVVPRNGILGEAILEGEATAFLDLDVLLNDIVKSPGMEQGAVSDG